VPPSTVVFGTVSALDVEAESPIDSSRTLGIGPLRSIKHHAIIDNQSGKDPSQYSDAERKIFLFSGDWDDGWPTTQRTDYPSNQHWGATGRQEMWFADVSSGSLGAGKVRFKLAQNMYHNYPWNGSSGYLSPAPQRGPFMPDALGFVVDKRGDFWMGPCDVGYTGLTGDVAGESMSTWAPMYKWKMPGVHPTTGVRLGNGWTRPQQNRLKSMSGGTQGVDWDVGQFSDSEQRGWGRPSTSAYDPTTDKIYVVGVAGGASSLQIWLYSFPCLPTNGQHLWTREQLAPKPMGELGVSNATGVAGTYGSGAICNTVYCNGSIYFTYMAALGVASGGNASGTLLRKSWILKVNLTTKAVDWVPYPSTMNWWLRPFDGPQAAAGYAPLTPGQYRSLEAVGNKLVMGPEAWHKVAEDPWIAVYDTQAKNWTLFNPPASYALTNGGHDYPNSIFSLVAMPSLGEVWLAGKSSGVYSATDPYEIWLQANGLHQGDAYQAKNGVWLGRRIIRFKVT
jgi:hypothetical protein